MREEADLGAMGSETEATFGERLRRLREVVGLSREELASRAGLSAKAIGALERGDRRHPHPHTFGALADALGLSGEAREELYAAIPERSAVPPEPTQSGGASARLPLPPTPLVGRSREVGAVRELLLEEGARLVTLVGAGGVGKTRLALEVAREVADSFPDGVAFVSLAPIGDPGLVVPEIARTLGIREAPGTPARDALHVRLRDKRLLLVLDNFEHLTGAATEVAALLSSCPGLCVLATSREALGLRGERRFPVPPLEVPDLSRFPTSEEVAAAAAAQLFVERAREVAPDFELTRQNAAAVAAICRRLDGLPLAIELAAALVRALPPREILARLDVVLPLLVGAPRDMPERQRTMRSAVAWSYELLDEAEKTALARLSVFSGGFTLEAAEAMLPPQQAAPVDRAPLDLVFSLLDKSLLVASTADEGRFGMLETIRAYGLERLQVSGEERPARERHEGIFLALAEEAEPHLNGPDRDAWMRRLEAEHDNIRAVLSYSLSEGRSEVALRIATAIFWFWLNGGHWTEGRSWFKRALEPGQEDTYEPRADLPTLAIRGKALYGAGALASFQGDYAASSPLLEESAAVWRELGSPTDLGYTLMFQNVEAMGKGEVDRALSLARESVALFRKTDDTFGLAVALSAQGTAHRAREEFTEAHIALEESAGIARESNDDWLLALPLQYLGLVTFKQGEYEKAKAYLKECLLTSIHRSGDEWFGASLLEVLASIAAYRGDPTRAARLYGAAEAMRKEIGTTVLPYEVIEHERGVMSAREALGEEGFAAAWAEGRTMTPEQRMAEAVG